MRFEPTAIDGAHLIDLEPHQDERGWFARAFCIEELAQTGLNAAAAQLNISRNPKLGTLRGMHFVRRPHEETKIVRCTRGSVYDVIVDVRRDSPSFGKWFGVELDAERARSLYIPSGVAHGFLTLQPDTDVLYVMGSAYVPGAGLGVRFDDPAFGVEWPAPPQVISQRDLAFERFR